MVPTTITIGDTLSWTSCSVRAVAADGKIIHITPSQGWELNYTAVGMPGVISINATAVDNEFVFAVTAADTAAYGAGDYSWVVTALKDDERYTVSRGTVKVLPDISIGGAIDSRSHAKKVLDAIEAVIEGRATTDQQSYTINGRSLVRTSIEDLLKLRSTYKQEYADELAADDIAAGLGGRNKIYTKFL